MNASTADAQTFENVKGGGRAVLWRHIFGDTPGLLAVWSGQRIDGVQELAEPTTRYYRWPDQASRASDHLKRESDNGREAYFCAHLLTKRRRIKPNAAQMLAAYVDGDGAQPGPALPRPTAIVESSPGRQQFYWRFTRAIDPAKAEDLNKRLAYAMGADKSGWDLTQVLRPPGCRNNKYAGRPRVKIISIEDRAYDPDELDAILPPLTAETTERPTVKLERSAAATPIGDRDQRALDRMRASARGAELQMLESGGSKFSKDDGSPDGNRDDLSLLAGYAFWLDKDPVRMGRAFEQTARYRPKLYEVHYANGETYLEHSIGVAIAGCGQTFRDVAGYDAGDEAPQIRFSPTDQPMTSSMASAAPCACSPDTCPGLAERDQTIRDLTAWVERLAGTVEDLQACNATLSSKLNQERELRALDRRAELAKQRIRRAFKPGQADAIIAVATIAPPIANAHQTDEPIITREMVAETNGSHPASAGENLKVWDLPGSPIKRIPKNLGTKSLTAYQLGGQTTAEILEKMADLGETLDRATPTRAKRVRCPDHPDAGTIVNVVCAEPGCGNLLDERHVAPSAGNASETRALEPPPPSVNDYVTSEARNARVAGRPEPDSDARAAAMVATRIRDVSKWRQPQSPDQEPVSAGRIRLTRSQEPPDDGPPLDQCIHGDGPLAPDSKAYCVEHKRELDAVPFEPVRRVAGGEG